ncbi:molybdopterin molybdotransferase MoeA [Rubritalea spongiae]|uniref:Molybdopterin molybdenumtransferase n=1 Tax=Rubritalea spongiae TaxID=430797 RepID=A0ABW5E294_9BACT
MPSLVQPLSAFDSISASLPLIQSEAVDLNAAFGRILRAPICADRPVPPFDRAMMDGIAIDSTAKLKQWKIAGIQAAGEPAAQLTATDQCFEIMTGAILPAGCDCVIPIEAIEIAQGQAKLKCEETYNRGNFIHTTASDHQPGSVLVDSGSLLRAPELSIAASCGATQVQVSLLPRITLITSGDEVVPPNQTPLDYQIRASHPTAIRSIIISNQLGTLNHLHIADDEDATRQAITQALDSSDAVILTGGVSKGKFDYIAPILRELAGAPLFHGVSQRPGKPLGYFFRDIPIFALPGNPLSVMACMARYVVPALRQMLGAPSEICELPLAAESKTLPHLTHLLAAKIENGQIHPSAPNNSGDYSALLACQGVVEMHPAETPLAAGSRCKFYPW